MIKMEDKEQIQCLNEESRPQKLPRNSGCWTVEEQEKYVIFLQIFKKQLMSKLRRKESRIFKLMARSIQTRDGIQCRSHHMKQLRTFGRMRKIIENFKKNHQFTQQGLYFRNVVKAMVQKGQDYSKSQQKYLEADNRHSEILPHFGHQQPSNTPIIVPLAGQEPNTHIFCSIIVAIPQNYYYAVPIWTQGMSLNGLPNSEK